MRLVTDRNEAALGCTTFNSVSRFLWAILVALAAVWSKSLLFLGMALVLNMLLSTVWGASFSQVSKVARYTVYFFVFIFLLHLFFNQGETLFRLGPLKATIDGARQGLLYGLKLYVFAFSALIIFATVDPFELIAPIERLARLLGALGQPLSALALTFYLALRFLPELSRQSKMTTMAFQSRGVSIKGGLLRKAKVAMLILAPLFVNAFKRAELAAAALNIKGYTTRHSKAIWAPVAVTPQSIVVVLASLGVVALGWHLG